LREGYSVTGLYLKSIHFLAEAFLDKDLSPEQRVEKAWYCKSFFILWKSNITDSCQFITWQTFKDLKCTCNGLILYLLLLKKRLKSAKITTYLLGSDANEQLFAWIRTGIFTGRRTDLDAITLAYGCEKRNLRSELALADDMTAYAHSRGRSILREEVPLPHEPWMNDTKEVHDWSSSDIKIDSLKKAMERGTKAVVDDGKKFNLPFLQIFEDENIIRLNEAEEDIIDPAELTVLSFVLCPLSGLVRCNRVINNLDHPKAPT
jgi:hypothetical protein